MAEIQYRRTKGKWGDMWSNASRCPEPGLLGRGVGDHVTFCIRRQNACKYKMRPPLPPLLYSAGCSWPPRLPSVEPKLTCWLFTAQPQTKRGASERHNHTSSSPCTALLSSEKRSWKCSRRRQARCRHFSERKKKNSNARIHFLLCATHSLEADTFLTRYNCHVAWSVHGVRN